MKVLVIPNFTEVYHADKDRKLPKSTRDKLAAMGRSVRRTKVRKGKDKNDWARCHMGSLKHGISNLHPRF